MNVVERKISIWEGMINFESSPKLNSLLVFCAYIYGWVCNLVLLDIKTFSWEFVVKFVVGIAGAGIAAFVVRIINIFVDEKIKKRIVNLGKKSKTKKT